MANGILSIIQGVAGSHDGSASGTPSVWKIVSGIGSVVETSAVASLARLTSILAQLDVALSTRASEATLTTIDADTGAIKTATEKVATETGVGTGLLVRQPTAANFNTTEASASATKTAVELIDDAVVAQDGAAAKAMTAGAELRDIAALPADGVAGSVRRLLASLKGILYTYPAYLSYGEGDTVPQLRTQHRGTYGTATAVSAQVVAVPCVLQKLLYSTTAGGQVDVRDGGAAGAIKCSFLLPIGASSIAIDAIHGTDVYYTFVAPLAGTLNAVYAPTA